MATRSTVVTAAVAAAAALAATGITYASAASEPAQAAAVAQPAAAPAAPAPAAPAAAPEAAPEGNNGDGGGRGGYDDDDDGFGGGGGGRGGYGRGHLGWIQINERSFPAVPGGCVVVVSGLGSRSINVRNDSRKTVEVFRGATCDNGAPIATVGPYSTADGIFPRRVRGGVKVRNGVVASFRVVRHFGYGFGEGGFGGGFGGVGGGALRK
ncbi:hypothetical protein ACFOZ0_25650 [Streptomyces yaanensis]|uniref:Secreted protein n=1 Tax=Streptomyces yaanensis TaxID=1142239 RepID=A0ABV7SJY0_9ACTN|nr:hypothetical protein [Streptomyces sp. CGMCC 4.7035]WNC01571.1 hypothetical protein Q2K21_27860 [Streptomyces sp. CGMCC 4.7035]